MKMKRFISAFAALAMSVSCFAGLAITANAATVVAIGTPTFTGNATVGSNTVDGVDNAITIDVNGNGDRSASWTFEANNTSQVARISFDMKINSGTNKNPNHVYINDGAGKNIIDIQNNSYMTSMTVNNESFIDIVQKVGSSVGSSNWFNVDAMVDFRTKKVTTKITNNSTSSTKTITADFVNSDATKLGGMSVTTGNGYGKVALSSTITVEDLVIPGFTLNKNAVEITALDGSDNSVTVSELTNDTDSSVAVSSSDNTIATASVSGNVITITGSNQNNGRAIITVTAESADGVKTNKEIEVSVGAKTYDVTVKYVVTGTTTAIGKGDVVLQNKAKDDVITTADVTGYSEDEFIPEDGSAKYIFNNSSQLPYTVTESDNQVVYIYFDKHDKVSSIALKYMVNGAVAQTVNYNIGTKYEGDENIVYYNNQYAVDANKKVVGVDSTNDPTKTGNFKHTTNLTQEVITNGIELDYTPYTGTAYFIEGSAITGKSGSTVNVDADYYSGGNARRSINETNREIFTVPVSGNYKITSLVVTNNANDRTSTFSLYKGSKDGTLVHTHTASETAGNLHKVGAGTVSTESVTLEKGDKLVHATSSGNVAVDYILLELLPKAEVQDGALFTPVNPATGEQETVSFDTLIGEDTLATKTIAVTIYDTEEAKPTMSINGGEEFTPQWTAKTNETAGTRTFYAQFMAAKDDFDKFGRIVVKYNDTEVLSTTLVTNSDPTP